MEADWEFEVGGGTPIIDACWPGLVDLRCAPERAGQLPETAQFPPLAVALARLNAAASPVWSSKCDFWPRLASDEFDPDELDAPPGSSAHAMGCYIDLLPSGGGQWFPPELAAADCQRIRGLLRAVPLRCCRADLVIRRAILAQNPADPERIALGVTAYLTACGASVELAAQRLAEALAAFADVFCGHSAVR
jgi:hypothetical protein